MTTLLGFLLALVIVVAVHEWGHFYTARRLGIPVVRFSIGMGPAIWSKQMGEVEYRFAWLPLGGYVLFADPRVHDVPAHQLNQVYEQQALWKKSLVVFAGPFINFVLAYVLMVLVLLVGLQSPKAWVAPGAEGTPWAQVSGTETWQIDAINDVKISQFEQLPIQLLRQLASHDELRFSLTNWQGQQKEVTVAAQPWRDLAWSKPQQQLQNWGLALTMPPLPAKLAAIEPGSAADQAGLQIGDWIVTLNGLSVDGFAELSQWVRENPQAKVELTVERAGQLLSIPLVVGSRVLENGQVQGFLGVRPQLPEGLESRWWSKEGLPLSDALTQAPQKLIDLTLLTLQAIGRLVTGQSGLEQLSGPIGIAQAAGNSLDQGWLRFFQFIALLSLSLGVLNLLPLPLLDGGHLLLYAVEGVRGQKFSESFLLVWQKIGMVMIVGLTLLAISSDLKRLFGG
ncbi:MAG TPA: RIP metalloprotease RseP [Thiotrichales bacterium]|nr:MAG: RIP metalloprotease RseP [Thiotrichales bacterium 35-46-9]HQR81413.1 RIP metalloprotease RseP [Thiotrichales bacterium]